MSKRQSKDHKLMPVALLAFRKGPVLIALLIGVFYCTVVLAKLNHDTTSVTNAAFAVTAVLCGLCLRMSSTLASEDPAKDRFRYAGERFLHSSLLLILASVVKYAASIVGSVGFFVDKKLLSAAVTFPIGILVSALFIWALIDAHTGFRIANDQLWARIGRARDWDDLV
jgi:hypothetical protein